MSKTTPTQDPALASRWPTEFPPRRVSSQRRNQKSTACEACKVKKIKCSGGPPCESCVRNGIECVVDETQDGRRKIAIKRTIDDLEKDRDLLLDLVASMRDGKNTYVEQLLSLIRGHGSLGEIRAYIDAQVREAHIEQTPELERLQQEIQESRSVRAREMRSIMDVQRLSDIPVLQNPGSRDMQAGQLDCEYCSPFLVNAILAEASALSDYVEVFTDRDDAATRGEKFLIEARRQLFTMDDFATLPTIQGLTILSVVYVDQFSLQRMSIIGKDRSGWMYLGMTIRAAQEYENSVLKGNMENGNDSISYALWGIFNMITTYSVSLMRYEAKPLPRYPRPKSSHNTKWDVWSPYPRQSQPVPGHISCISHGWSDLIIIVSQIGKWMCNKEEQLGSDMATKVTNFYKELQNWKKDLPTCVQAESASVPQTLYLHMQE
ncbi:C6 transcription factor, putative [Talaromyces stipitatus ATCC 10500]|uniref:C6 transcription factor, putative n=1 Tax=Talaromyces stipitatus (strain ATCC 10500 / CBS 375.48 / QM 6759 / NRRL 1006) TaxID=441959 RepID=B8MBL9_TALSN|nr:C6 transcription factor, putative [Talaromyces stipitatus ATCC 10500]EED17883.1 C6 transcription factor, putative [Talaromyces stipitatus ATCC 10500]